MSLTVLAVDDSRTMRDMLNFALQEAGFKPHLAEDGEHALEVLNGISPDAIITDINMPKLDGFGFIKAVRKQDHHRGTPILVLSTESADSMKSRARSRRDGLDRETLRPAKTRQRPETGDRVAR